mmetsp:Transcript_44663/g.103174  ORF Transcript_44663/g.103174 Transcript_44663/m.103174 type:complete len:264 (+) Transcript_44663:55-846(+)
MSFSTPNTSLRMAGGGATNYKIAAFRDFATQLCGQVVEQLCQEYEREVNVMYQDLVQYRGELGRVADLLSGQLQREKQLHDMMETLLGHHESSVSFTRGHGEQARQLMDPLKQTEQELSRIMQLLSVPLIPEAAPRPTRATVPVVSTATTPVYSSSSRPQTPRRVGMFDMMDQNHDGVITRDEFRRAAAPQGGSCSVLPGRQPPRGSSTIVQAPPPVPVSYPCTMPPPPAGGMIVCSQPAQCQACVRPMMPGVPPIGAPCMVA